MQDDAKYSMYKVVWFGRIESLLRGSCDSTARVSIYLERLPCLCYMYLERLVTCERTTAISRALSTGANLSINGIKSVLLRCWKVVRVVVGYR